MSVFAGLFSLRVLVVARGQYEKNTEVTTSPILYIVLTHHVFNARLHFFVDWISAYSLCQLPEVFFRKAEPGEDYFSF